MNCIFCDIIERKAPAEIIFEDDKVLAFLDIKPIHYGHILVVPKKHYSDLLEIPGDALCSIIKTAKMVTGALVKSLKPDGYNLFSNNGKAAGQSVFHFHMHITPRYFKDEIHFKLKLKDYKNTEMQNIASLIKNEISNYI
ncbi:MAG: HIT family protein [Ignavibacteriales bacterium]|nr:MAG: HIT family protein [Ignavibacteriales bacterium]